jgi:2-polyprenyl-6-hydroxyphenyl methylase/3-demethylubiquinone-9 3-methyltransferase
MEMLAMPPNVMDAMRFTFDDYNALFAAHGGTDSNYLKRHFRRFQNTFARVMSTWPFAEGQVVVDVGAHWLHQSLFYAQAGFKVEAFNLPTTFKKERVKRLAEAHKINLTIADELQTGECFYGLPENSVDIVLFTEILEHITFNPLRFWKTIYHVMKPGGRIIVTTPNYYSLIGRGCDFRRLLSGYGEGLSVSNILDTRTFGHHWKEYSMKEVLLYFSLLSPDFRCVKSTYTDDRNPDELQANTVKEFLLKRVAFLKPNLHVEIELVEKNCGIPLTPSW